MIPRTAVLAAVSNAAMFDHPATWGALVDLAVTYGAKLDPPVTAAEVDELRHLTAEQIMTTDPQPGPGQEIPAYGIDRENVLATIKVLAATALPDLADAEWRTLPAAQVTDIIARQVLAGVQPYLDNHLIESVKHLQERGIIVYRPPQDRP